MIDRISTPPEGHDPSIEIQPDYDDYGLYQQESETTVIRIDHDTSVFERIVLVESKSTGVVLKEQTRLRDDVVDDAVEAYTPIQFISARADGFSSRLQTALFDLVYAEKVSEEVAEQLSENLAENFSQQFTNFSCCG